MLKKIKGWDGIKITYDIHRKKNKLFLIFIHGLGTNKTIWKKERKILEERGFSTLAVDLRGHGLSERPKEIKDYEIDKFAKDIFYILKKEKIKKFVVVGHSFGGIVLISFHKLYPSLSKGYVMIDSTYKLPNKFLKKIKKHPFIMDIIEKIASKIKRKEIKKENSENKRINLDWNLFKIIKWIYETGFCSWVYTLEEIAKFNGLNILKTIEQPVLILQGENDSIFDLKIAKKMKKLIKNSKLEIIPYENHHIIINNPEEITKKILDFIQKV